MIVNKLKLSIFIFVFISFFSLSQEDNDIAIIKNELKNSKTDAESVTLLLKHSEKYLDKEAFDSVISYAQKIPRIDYKIENNISANVLLGRANIALGNYEQGKEILEGTIEYLISKKDKRLPQVHLSLGNAYMNLNILQKALINFKASEKLATEEDKARVYMYFSIFYSNTRQYERALNYLNRVTALANKYGDKPRLAGAYAYFAKLNSDREDYNEAIRYYNLALELYTELNSKYNIAVIENNVAECYVSLKDIETAKKHFNTALKYSIKNNYSQLGTIIKSNLAKQDILRDYNIEESIEELNVINNLDSPIEIKGLICENYYYLAIGYLKKLDTSKAMKSISIAIKIAEEEGFPWSNEQNFSLLSSINYNKKNYIEAYLNAQKVIKYKEEIYNENKNKEIELLRTKFDLNQKENEIQLKEQKLILIDEREKKNRYLYISIGLILIFIIISLFRQNKLVRIKRKVLLAENSILNLKEDQLNKEIKSKNDHVTNLALDIAEKNSFLEDLKVQIKKTKNKTTNQTIQIQLQNILINITDYIKRNQDRIQLILEVDKANKEFYDRLKIKYSDLTDREIKIIGYLRINMSSYQIANTLNITELSVNNIRSKIRKKLHIDKSENFITFLKKI